MVSMVKMVQFSVGDHLSRTWDKLIGMRIEGEPERGSAAARTASGAFSLDPHLDPPPRQLEEESLCAPLQRARLSDLQTERMNHAAVADEGHYPEAEVDDLAFGEMRA